MTTNTRPVPNVLAPIGEARTDQGKIIASVYLVSPWMQFWQQFVQKAAAVVNVVVGTSPFSYTPNQNGKIVITGGTISNISLIRGTDITNITGEKIIPVTIGDTVSVTYSVTPSFKFFGG